MKKLLIPALLLATASSYGALATATGTRLTDYTNWFEDPFAVASDANYLGIPYPSTNTPDGTAIDDANRDWTGWTKNWNPTGLKDTIPNPFANPLSSTKNLIVEVVFLGETAGWWDDWGYTLNGVTDVMLADSVQTIGWQKNRWFGDYAFINLLPGQSLDLFVTGTGKSGNLQDGLPSIGVNGGKYYVFNTDNNLPDLSDQQSYYGTLNPLTSARGVDYLDPFTIVAFEDIKVGGAGRDSDYNDFIFAFRAGYDIPQGGVPEPSTYGLIGAAALLGLIGYRRFKKA